MFQGTLVAMVTPFTKDGQVNHAKVKELVDFHLEKGTNGLVPSGTTGESPTLTGAEKLALFGTVIEAAAGRIPVIAGTGNYNTRESLEMTRSAKNLGADAALVITPYYNKPTQEGLYRHFMTIADSVDLPLIVYNVPGRTSVNILPETVARLADHPNIVAVKEASGNLAQVSRIHELCGDKITILSGDDGLLLPILSVGGQGVISVTGNIVPDRINSLIAAFEQGNHREALAIHRQLADLNRILFIETNPIPIKTAMNMMGFEMGSFRLPLCDLSPQNRKKLEETLRRYELIS